MTVLVLIGLIVAVAVLWQRVGELRTRVAVLERSGIAVPPFVTVAPEVVPTVEPLVAPVEVQAADPAPRLRPSPARIVRDTTPSLPTPPRDDVLPPIEPAPSPARTMSFEDIFGRRLPIWAGGITLAICGALIVKYSVDSGLLSPLVRVVAALLFGLGLIAGAEAARQNQDRVRDPRVAQALAGAGVATLYAGVLVATDLYHLVGPFAGFVGLAGVTLLAALLSLRFGAPSAVLGLLGGLAAPALVSTGAPDIPLLCGYLALAIGGLATLGRTQRWPWLSLFGLIGGFGWGLVMLVTTALDQASVGAIGLFLMVMGIGLPVLLFGGGRGPLVRWAGVTAAALELAALMVRNGFRPLDWALFGLLSVATVWLSTRERALRDLPGLALAIALLLMVFGSLPESPQMIAVVGGACVIFGAPAGWRVWRADGRLTDAGQIAALAAAVWLVPWVHADEPTASHLALLALVGAALAAGVAALGWTAERSGDHRFALLVGTAATLVGIAAWTALPDWLREPGLAGIAAGLLALAPRARDRRLDGIGCAFAVASAGLLVQVHSIHPMLRAWGVTGEGADLREALRWAGPAAAVALFAWRSRLPTVDRIGASGAVLLGYVALAQIVPPPWLPLIPAAAIMLIAATRLSTSAGVTAGALAGAWALVPLGRWLLGSAEAAVGEPLFVTALPDLRDVGLRLLVPALAVALLLWRNPPRLLALRRAGTIAAALLGGVAIHVGYKHLFALGSATDFVDLGLAERSSWEAALALAAVMAFRPAWRVAYALGAASLAHFAWFTILLHNPLWAEQMVGVLPLANLLLPTYGVALALLWAAGRFAALSSPAERARQIALMVLTALFALSELRQFVHGALLTGVGVTPAEDIARSVLAIGLAIGFLQWGIRARRREWRIGSLLLMLVAVVKVFLFDTAGLDGLLRIGSFAALGFSLIGIGWLYSRYLPADAVNPLPTAAA